MALKTDFVDALFEQKKIRLNENGDGTVTPVDETEYTRQGDKFGAKEINATNEAVNGLSEDMVDLKKSVSDGKAQVAAAITAKRVPTAATATFGEMAANIGKIVLGSGNAVPSDVLAGKTFTNNDGVEYTGTMPNCGDYNGWGNSKGNDAGNQRMWVKVPHGYYNENANVFLSWADIRAMAGITPEKIKKNEPIMGIIGSFEGYVAGPTDLYNRGQNPYNFTGTNVTNESGGLRFVGVKSPYGDSDFKIISSGAFNFVPYSKLRIWFLVDQIKHYSDSNYIFKFHIYNESTKIAEASFGGNLNTMYMMELNISSYAATSILQVILETEFYNDASGSDSDPTWSTSAFNGWIYQIAVA